MEKILILDNYDSFTYNIVHLLHELGAEVDIARNEPKASAARTEKMRSSGYCFSSESKDFIKSLYLP